MLSLACGWRGEARRSKRRRRRGQAVEERQSGVPPKSPPSLPSPLRPAPDSSDKGMRYEVLMTCLSLFAPREPTRRLQGPTLQPPRVRIHAFFPPPYLPPTTQPLATTCTTSRYFFLPTPGFVGLMGQWGGRGGRACVRRSWRCDGEATRSRGRPRAERGLVDGA